MVHDPTGGRHDHVRAALEALELRRIALAAVDRQHVKAGHPHGVLLEGLGHLDGQLAGRHHHQRLRGILRDIDPGQYGQRESGRLAGARLGLAEHVLTIEKAGDGLALDGRGGLVTHRGQCLKQGIGKAQLTEAGYFEVIGHLGECARAKGGRIVRPCERSVRKVSGGRAGRNRSRYPSGSAAEYAHPRGIRYSHPRRCRN